MGVGVLSWVRRSKGGAPDLGDGRLALVWCIVIGTLRLDTWKTLERAGDCPPLAIGYRTNQAFSQGPLQGHCGDPGGDVARKCSTSECNPRGAPNHNKMLGGSE